MELYVIVAIAVLTPTLLIYIQIAVSTKQTDHVFHQVLIELIRRNKNKFIEEHSNFLYSQKVLYPQLLHWCLALLPDKLAAITGKYISAIAVLLSSIALTGFILMFLPDLNIQGISITRVLIIAMAIYTLTPYTFNMDNAKNVGMSVRGVGLLMTQLYMYAIVIYVFTGNYWFLVMAGVLAWLILLANIFCAQFILFSAPLFAFFYSDWLLICPLIGSYAFFLVTMPKIAVRYLAGQLLHKKKYSKYIAAKTILQQRYSIWRDWVYDFWKEAYLFVKGKTSAQDLFRYIYGNAVVAILTGMPFIVLVVIYFGDLWIQTPSIYQDNSNPYYVLMVPVIISLLVFAATSFRKTRFLGEPERYVEIALVFAAINGAIFFHDNDLLLAIVMVACSIAMAVQYYIYVKIIVKRRSTLFLDNLERLDEHVNAVGVSLNQEIKLISNNIQISKYFMSPDRKVFWGIGIPENIAGLNHRQLFDQMPFLKEGALIPLIKELGVNCLIIQADTLPNYKEVLIDKSLSFEEVHTENNFILFKVCLKD